MKAQQWGHFSRNWEHPTDLDSKLGTYCPAETCFKHQTPPGLGPSLHCKCPASPGFASSHLRAGGPASTAATAQKLWFSGPQWVFAGLTKGATISCLQGGSQKSEKKSVSAAGILGMAAVLALPSCWSKTLPSWKEDKWRTEGKRRAWQSRSFS